MAGNGKQRSAVVQEPKPPFPEQSQQFPGYETQMQPKPDHGEKSYKGTGKLLGRAALITGADSGIGKAVALAFAREGADVLISYLDEEQDARETEDLVKQAGRKALRVPGDIRDQRHCQQMVQQAMDEFGRLDILVNNAAYQKTYSDITEIPDDEFDRTFRTNVYALFYLCKAAVPHMKPGSSIINTASIEAYDPAGGLFPYTGTKGAVVDLTKSLAKLVAQKQIRVNAVAPGPVWTPLNMYGSSPEKVKSFGKNTLFGRPAQPAEMAPIYVFLASPEASYVTGEVYGATGGRSPT